MKMAGIFERDLRNFRVFDNPMFAWPRAINGTAAFARFLCGSLVGIFGYSAINAHRQCYAGHRKLVRSEIKDRPCLRWVLSGRPANSLTVDTPILASYR